MAGWAARPITKPPSSPPSVPTPTSTLPTRRTPGAGIRPRRSGLAGTGSHDIVLEQIFVPEAYSWRFGAGMGRLGDLLPCAGQTVGLIRDIVPAAAIVRRISIK
jgi:hypothetical protein